MELDEFDGLVATGEVPGEACGQVGFSGARRPVEDDLPFVSQQVGDVPQPGHVVEVELSG